MLTSSKWLKYAGIGTALLLLLGLYYSFNPLNYDFFPQCPLRLTTGYQCPGCGSQRALHALLHGQWATAYAFNPLLVISLPYLLLGFALEFRWVRRRASRLRSIAFGYWASLLWAVVTIGYWVGRNL